MQSKENVMKMFEMRLEGKTLEEIGQHFGVTRQRIYQILDYKIEKARAGRKISKCVFPGIANWLYKNETTLKELCEGVNCMCGTAFYQKMHGEKELKMSQIKAILAFTGMTFEEAFGEQFKPEGN